MTTFRRLVILVLLALSTTVLSAQTPIANRVKAAARHLPKDASVLARYTDNERHCLYYIRSNRIFRLDVVLNINEGLDFAAQPYHRILSASLSPNGDFMVICIEREAEKADSMANRLELWRIHSKDRSFHLLGSGFAFHKTERGYTLKKVAGKKQPHTISTQHFDRMGNAIRP